MIGDSSADVLGGRDAGATTVWLRRGGGWPEVGTRPDHEADSVDEALDLAVRHLG